MFLSDNVTTLSILKDYVTKEATTTHTTININAEIEEESVAQFLQLVAPLLEFQLDLRKKHEVIEALQELKMQEDDISFLEAEYMSTLQNAELIAAEVKVCRRRALIPPLDYSRSGRGTSHANCRLNAPRSGAEPTPATGTAA